MTDRALSEEAMLASLRDIQLPAEAAGGLVADLAATVGLAGLVALILAGLIRLLSRSAQRPQRRDPLAESRALPEAERRVALLHLLRARAPERYAAIRGEIYAPGGGVDLATLEAEVRRHA
ncbi:hypothetical protein [Roseobacter sinensis]|uniref:Uncharacterized protein n=1 Tax=Roseobacter sinensis TaxID=2931391 RepID=A0ABT3BKF1_9RHOB|nr:hypothetical protein [Roseobacter sp. WL0113]MCV3274054.1 hypothetical protein [Roseobacter sp. WL0113]